MLEMHLNNRLLCMSAACLTLAYTLPYHARPFLAFYNDWLPIFGLIVFLASYAALKKASFVLPSIAILPVFLAGAIAAQVSLGMLTESWDALLPITYLLLMGISMVLGATMAKEKGGAVKLCTGLAYAHLGAGMISVIIASLQFVGAESLLGSFAMQMGHPPGVAIRPYANLGQPNQLALLFLLSIVSVWFLYQRGVVRAGIASLAVFSLLWGVSLTQSRIGWVIIPLFILFFLTWRREIEIEIIPKVFLFGFLLYYAILIFLLPDIASFLGVAALSATEHIGSTHSPRLIFLREAMRISYEHLWFGAGWYEFGPQQISLASEFARSEYSQHSHNIVANFAAEMGWPITILVFGLLTCWFSVGVLRRRIGKETAFAILFFCAVLVHSLTEYPLWYAFVLLPLGLLMGMAHQKWFFTKNVNVKTIYLKSATFLLFSCLMGVAIDYRHLIINYRAFGWELLGLKADEGTTNKPEFTIFPYFYDYFKAIKTKAHTNMSPNEIVFMEHVTKRFGYPPMLMRMSLIYALNNRPDKAVKAMVTLSRLHSSVYADGYEIWKKMAESQPEKYSYVFVRIPDINKNNSQP